MSDFYQPGTSFINPRIHYSPIEARKFSLVKYGRGKSARKYETYPALWRRSAKARTMQKLGISKKSRTEMPTFGEVGLGQATVSTAPKLVERSFWGSLTSILTTGAEFAIKQQETKMAKIQAEIAAQEAMSKEAERGIATASVMQKLPWILGIGGGALLVTMLVIRRKRK